MKTYRFKRTVFALALLLMGCYGAMAQETKEWSIIPYAKIGYVMDGTVSTVSFDEVYHANVGVNAKVSFNKHWSLLTGVEYSYRWGFHENASGWFHPADHREGLRHFIRIPVCAEFTHKWFYADAGLFVERATNTRYDANETVNFSVGPVVEVGGRIRLSENDLLRIGCQSQLCVNHVTENGQSTLYGGFFGGFLTIGYEHRF